MFMDLNHFRDVSDRLGISIYRDLGRDRSLLIGLADNTRYEASRPVATATVYIPATVD